MRVGIVVTTQDGRAEVSTARQGPCGSCSEQGACSLPIATVTNSVELVTAKNQLGAKPGDTVEIDLAGHTELGVSLLVWIVPMVGLIGGAVLGVLTREPLGLAEDPAALLGAGIGVAAAYLGLRRLDRRVTDDPRLVPEIIKVVAAPSCTSLPGVAENVVRIGRSGGNASNH